MPEGCTKMMAEINTPGTHIMTSVIKYEIWENGTIYLSTSDGIFVTHISNVLIIGDRDNEED